MRISDWSSDVCSSDLVARIINDCHDEAKRLLQERRRELDLLVSALMKQESLDEKEILEVTGLPPARSEEHTSELQSLMRISYAVFCLKKKNINTISKQDHESDAHTQVKNDTVE